MSLSFISHIINTFEDANTILATLCMLLFNSQISAKNKASSHAVEEETAAQLYVADLRLYNLLAERH